MAVSLGKAWWQWLHCPGNTGTTRLTRSRGTKGREAVEIGRRVMGAENLYTLMPMSRLAKLYAEEGNYARAEALFDQTLEIQRRVLGREHPHTLLMLTNAGIAYQRQGKYSLSESFAEQALAGRRRALGGQRPDTTDSEAYLALAYISEGKFTQSEPVAREALETEKKTRPNNWQRFRAASLLGASLAGEKNYAEGEPLLLEGYQGMLVHKESIAVPDRYNLDLAQRWIVQLYQAWGKPEKAAEWKKKFADNKKKDTNRIF